MDDKPNVPITNTNNPVSTGLTSTTNTVQQPIRHVSALPSRPAAMGLQKGQLASSLNGVAYQSSVSLTNILNEYQETYTDTCFRRTGPYNGTMPLSFERWLRAVDLATTSDKGGGQGNTRAKVSSVAALYGQADKNSESSYVNLCRMTAEPFPLISSGRAATGDSVKSKIQPLIDQQTLFATSMRYARVVLSDLGKIAVRWYKNYKMNEIDQHRSIIPLSLLRKTQVWTLGFKTEMRPMNPAELFYLMAKLIEYYDRTTGVRADLSDADIAEFFKGPDLGEGYTTFMSNESLMSLYSAGRASITVVPDVVVNTDDNTIMFKRPVLDKAARDLATFFLRKLQVQMNGTDQKAPIYRSFTYTDVDVNGPYTTLKNCDFLGNAPETVRAELWGDVDIQKSIVITNTILEPIKDDTVKIISSKEGIHYKADCKSIPESLWMHIEWEKENQLKNFYNQKKYFEDELRTSKLLEKVTRPPIAEYVHSIMKETDRIGLLLATLGEGATSQLKQTAFSDGVFFNKDEANEIFRERVGATTIGGSKIQILAILFKRDAYKDLWITIENQLAEVQKIIDNPNSIYDIIYSELVTWMRRDEWQRKSSVYFLADAGINQRKSKDAIVYYTPPSPTFDDLNMPCSIYHNNYYVAKSFGANMNIILDDVEKIPNKVLNCTTQDYVGLLHGETITYLKATAIPSTPHYMGDVIKNIIPYCATGRLMLNIVVYDLRPDGSPYMKECYYRVIQPGPLLPHPKTGVAGLNTNEFIEGFVYLDSGATHIDIRTVTGLKRVKVGDIPTDRLTHAYPTIYGTVTDLREVHDINEGYPILYAGYTDQVLDRTEKTKQYTESDWEDDVRILTGEYSPKFATNIELYYHTLHLYNWLDTNFIIEQKISHAKKSVIPENRWIRNNDALSRLISKKIIALNTQEQGAGQRMINSQCTQEYKEWNVDKLEDWGVIDKRFGISAKQPTNPEAMKVYTEYMNDRFLGLSNSPEVPSAIIAKLGIDYNLREQVIEDTETIAVSFDSEFIDDVSMSGEPTDSEDITFNKVGENIQVVDVMPGEEEDATDFTN